MKTKQMQTLTNINSKMKTVLAFFVLALFVSGLSAQTTLPINKATGKIDYRFTIPVNGNVSNEEAYEMATNWFGTHAKEFTRSNVSVAPQNISGVNASRLAETLTIFFQRFKLLQALVLR